MSDVEAEAVDVLVAEMADDPAVDAEVAAPTGEPCEWCGAPIESGDKFCPGCGQSISLPAAATAAPDEAPAVAEEVVVAAELVPAATSFECDNCGSRLAAGTEQRSYVCPFCDSTYVTQLPPELSGRQEPEFVIGFSVTREAALAMFHAWMNEGSWIRPGDLRRRRIDDKLQGVYLPFWSFSMLARSEWSAEVGEYWYETETFWTTDSKGKRVRKTRRVRRTEWWPLDGKHHRYYSGYLVSGSRGLPQRDAERIKPFQLPALKRYEPFYLAGWLCEEYSVGRDEALKVSKSEFYRREQANVARFLPGDTHRQLDVSTRFSDVNSDLCLLPVYLLSYRYKEKVYRFLVNGQTGKCAGEKPVSWKRITAIVGGVAAAIALVIVLMMLLANL